MLRFPKLGPIRITLHRAALGKHKTCAIVREVDQWFAVITTEQEIADPAPLTAPVIGIDRGCANLLADSDGRIVENPRHLRRTERRLARAQQTASRRKKGSANRAKANVRVAKIHRTIRRQRDAVLHRESLYYARTAGVVVVEKLQIGNMSAAGGSRKRGLNRSILSAGWGRLVQLTKYKMADRGGSVVEEPPQNTSRECSACGVIDIASRLSQAAFRCTSCGHEEYADTNAAKVIRWRYLDRIAVEPTVTACGGFGEVSRPVKQELRVVRRGTRILQGRGAPSKAPAFRPG